jgi:aminopeptidase N
MKSCTTGGVTGSYVEAQSGNWSEGLTTFLADYAYSEERSAAAARDAASRLAARRRGAAGDQPASAGDFRSRQHGAEAAIGYGKAAMLFLMLRDLHRRGGLPAGLRDFLAGAALPCRRLGRPAAGL